MIEGSTFDVGDDAICIKSGRDEEGRKRGKPTENVIIRNNVVYKAHGVFVIGSEMSGGAKNILFMIVLSLVQITGFVLKQQEVEEEWLKIFLSKTFD